MPTTQSQSQAPLVLVESAENTQMSNYPTSVENARDIVQAYLESKLKEGYVFNGVITREVGADVRSFLVFYKYPGPSAKST